jgi:hypothetical protein
MGEPAGASEEADELRRKLAQACRLLAQERQRMDTLLSSLGPALGRIEERLIGIETALTLQTGVGSTGWLIKMLAGLVLPIAAMILAVTADIQAIGRMLAPP